MSHRRLQAIYKELSSSIADSQDRALFEVKELKQDLSELQRVLSGRKKSTTLQPEDIIRSAYEIAFHFQDMTHRQEVLDQMQDVADRTDALIYLESRGAKFIKRPAGYHFQTSKERFLLHDSDPVLAAAELKLLLAAGKRLKRPKKVKKVVTT